jgi:dephospho-CoA kinase
MKVLGLTGGVGMGKSACIGLLRACGIPVIDTDDLAREVVRPGEPALGEIRGAFGPDVFNSDGQLLRAELARRVFNDPAARRRLEAILHPPIRRRWRSRVETWRAQRLPRAIVVIPLLFETQAEKELDETICVACTAATQRERLAARGWTPEEIDQRIAAQWPAEVKIARADYVIWTEGDLGVAAEQINRILQLSPLSRSAAPDPPPARL